MPDRTQEIKNLRQVFTASVNYANEVRDDLRWELGTYDLGVDTVNGTTSLLPTPANTIQASMVRIDGDSEVSENLIVLQDVTETTINGITYSITNGVITLSGTASAWVSITLFSGSLSGTYTFKDFGSGTSTASNNIRIAESGSYTKFIPLGNKTTATDINAIQFYCEANTTLTNVVIKPMLVKGSTAPTDFKVGYEGIHNLELSGLVVKNSDDEVSQTLPIDLTSIEDSGGNKLFADGKLREDDYLTPYKATKVRKQYTIQATDKFSIEGGRLLIIDTNITDNKQYGKILIDAALTPRYSYNDVFNNVNSIAITIRNNKATILIYDSSITTVESGKTAFVGKTIEYELATPIEVSIDFSQLVKFEAYSNGSITLVNTNNQDTTSTFKYLKEVAK